MKLEEFEIGAEFECGGNRWRCTDIGARVVLAIEMDPALDTSWFNGPPYAVAESVFDENDQVACSPVKAPLAPVARARFLVRLRREELVILGSALNEVCHGFEVPEFQTRIGSTRSAANDLLQKISRLIDQSAQAQ